MSLRAWSCFAAVSVLWGIPYLFIKLAVEEVPPAFVAWGRVVIGAAILLPWAWRAGLLAGLRGRMRWALLWGLTEIAIPFPLIAFGEQHVSSSLTAILIASAPLMVALLGEVLDPAERVRGARLAGLVIGLAGVVALMGIDVAGRADELLGAGAILLGTLCYAVGPFNLRGPLAGADSIGVVAVALAFAAVALTPLVIADPPAQTPSGTAIASIVVLGVLCSAAALVLFAILVALVVRNHPPNVQEDVSVNTDTGAVRVVTSSIDTRVGIRAAWSHPGTRLAFWSHFTTPFAGTAFILLWGVPFLTAGEGLSPAAAAGVTTLYIVVSMALGPVMGGLSARIPHRRSRVLVLPTVAVQLVAWLAVIAWPGRAPLWLLIVLVIALATGGPASLIAFDHARTHNPSHRLSTATGITNVGGFLAALIAIFLIGAALDMQGAGTPDTYSLEAFRFAFLTQVPLWLIGAFFIVLERRRTRIHIGWDQPRRPRRDR